MASVDSDFEKALQLLRGTDANFVMCCVSMGLSVTFAVVGIAAMTESRNEQVAKQVTVEWTSHKTSALQSVVFLAAQSFTLAKVARDFWCFKASDPGKPSVEYFGQVVLFFAIAFGFALASLVTLAVSLDWSCLYAVALLWTVVNAMCLSKAVRDRADAQRFSTVKEEEREATMDDLFAFVHGTVEYRACVWFAALAALCLLLALTWSWEDLALERKGFISVCAIWCETSCFHFAKLVRDRNDAAKAEELKLQIPYQFLVSTSMLASITVLLGGALAMPLDAPKRLFLAASSGFLVTSAAFLAKHVRDQQEIIRLQAAASKQQPADGAVVDARDVELVAGH